MIKRNHEPPVKRPAELALMRRIHEPHLEHPFAGSQMLRDFLRVQGIKVGRQRVGTLMRRKVIQAPYRKPIRSMLSVQPSHLVCP